ncbi:transposase [Burkholderia sp. Bp8986]|uniref:transposase n=1 Tax=Burkholderia sp. Bp8986 TaxID=2184550 RepID=UPI0021AB8CB0|nr:transposase [Burkholderia sp. Bp8986]
MRRPWQNRKRSTRTVCSLGRGTGNLIPIRCNGNQIDEASGAWKTTGIEELQKEFREAVAAEANDPNRSIAEVARAHGLNANMVAQWRRSLRVLRFFNRPQHTKFLTPPVKCISRDSI